MTARTAAVMVSLVVAVGTVARADVFNLGGSRNPVTGQWTGAGSLEFVTVGDPGNAADSRTSGDGVSHFGAVGYAYQMGKYDVTTSQYAQFLNVVATTADPYGLYSSLMAPSFQIGYCGIVQSGSPGSYSYSAMPGRENFPVSNVSWGDVARFCNWLANGQPTGSEGPGTTETGSYTLNGAMTGPALRLVDRNPGATYVLPSNDEYYKAAYYMRGSTSASYWLYPTCSNQMPSNVLAAPGVNSANYAIYDRYHEPYMYTDPVNYLTPVGAFAGSPGPYGTFDMGGDVWQWTEGRDSSISFRGSAGGSFSGDYSQMWATFNPTYGDATGEGVNAGLRIALVPEPVSVLLLVMGGTGIMYGARAPGGAGTNRVSGPASEAAAPTNRAGAAPSDFPCPFPRRANRGHLHSPGRFVTGSGGRVHYRESHHVQAQEVRYCCRLFGIVGPGKAAACPAGDVTGECRREPVYGAGRYGNRVVSV